MDTDVPRQFLDAAVIDEVLARTERIASIAGPPLDERARGDEVEAWFVNDGCGLVRRDQAGNVWARCRTGSGPAVVVAAHLDTVFARTVQHGLRRQGDRLIGPSVGDDSVALASLAMLPSVLPSDLERPVWLLATVGEEGLGNLRGIRHALDVPQTPIGSLLAVEGNYLGRVGVVGVGSVRLRITYLCVGGHAWERRSEPSAVHLAGRAIAQLDTLAGASGADVAVNVGIVTGGEAINARAQSATFDIDLRADRQESLDDLRAAALQIVGEVGRGATSVEQIELGNRPAGSIDRGHPLVATTLAAYREAGVESDLIASSTDANAAFAAGIPAVAVGVAVGADEHTEQEWIDVTTLASGLTGFTGAVIAAAGRRHP